MMMMIMMMMIMMIMMVIIWHEFPENISFDDNDDFIKDRSSFLAKSDFRIMMLLMVHIITVFLLLEIEDRAFNFISEFNSP